MGKGSRKGKKAWRKAKTDDIEDAVDKANADAQNGGAVEDLADDSLFFVDTAPDEPVKLSRKEKRANPKPLHTDVALLTNPKQLYPKPTPKYTKRDKFSKSPGTATKSIAKIPIHSRKRNKTPQAYDLWGSTVEEPAADLGPSAKLGWMYSEDTLKKPTRKVPNKTRVLPAVEVDMDGCSFNPDTETHQEALAVAVAAEVEKELKKQLNPIQDIATGAIVQNYIEDELYRARSDDEDEDDEEQVGTAQQDEQVDKNTKANVALNNKLTKTQRNKQARKHQQDKEAEARRALKRMRQELEALPQIEAELEDEAEEHQARLERRKTTREERAAAGPGRLGGTRFEAAPVQVQLSEDVNGSIRTLKACSTLVKDRFKSLQRRAIIEPRKPATSKKFKNKIEYEPGTRGQGARDMHEARMAERQMGKSMM